MTFRSRSFVLAAVGLWMAHPLPAKEPSPLRLAPMPAAQTTAKPANNQQLADMAAFQLAQSAVLKQYTISVVVQDGVAELQGTVTDETQKQEALRIVHGVSGITRVKDQLQVRAIVPVQAIGGAQPPGQPPPATLPPPAPNGGLLPPPVAAGPGALPEPVPISQTAPPSYYELNPPRMPPHAWPTYAPYNNFSRVAYPTKYPYQAWPFIGPFYPFPKVPLGWRSIKLEWEDGHWWYKKYATCHDWWRIRYW